MSTIKVTNLSGRGGASPNLPDGAVITGVVTATSFSGSGANLTGVANTDFVVGTAITMAVGDIANVNLTKSASGAGATVGSYTGVTTYYGDGSNLTGVGETIAPWHYNPDVNDSEVTVDTGIGITFNKKVVAGSGTATIKIVNAGAAGTTVQSWGVSSCTFSTTEFTLGALVSILTVDETYQVDIPSGFIKDGNDTDYVGTAWTFSLKPAVRKMWAMGNNTTGWLGQNNRQDYSSPVQIPGTTWADFNIETNQNTHILAKKTDGTLWAMGNNVNGCLGQNSQTQYSSPVQIPGTTWALAVPFTNAMTAAVRTDGTLWTFGDNSIGALGQNNRTDYSSPKQVGSGTDWRTTAGSIAGGYRWMSALKTDGTLWSMGYNQVGELGQNNKTKYSSPVQVPGTTWNYLGGGYINACAVKTDGTLWTWGRNDEGQLGQNASGNWLSSPVQVPGTTWSKVSGGEQGFLATKTDGTAWGWGRNQYGQLGQNNTVKYSSPVQIPGTWTRVGHAHDLGLGLKSDGTLWGFGRNEYGAFGNNDVIAHSSPVQIAGTEGGWTSFIAADSGLIANQLDVSP